ncbi:hypothetical protein [Anaerocolumna sp. MB42-C2]|uniref:hypothetical protein n=1 Tax=Anaerocolumna sp. MB42-C2 TaxID=3070997 RepID=UPI0027E0A4F7|nr:hypothetical protein [Anaerocolumna sp. MB42-C2]WMJ85540.1 hypothetical protein RBU59_15855 [Anaerocolumna sp. MB42-C2]
MYLLREISEKPYLFTSLYLLGFEFILTIFMLVYIFRCENFYDLTDNMSVKEMLAAAKLQ